jgi:hypothetical protein
VVSPNHCRCTPTCFTAIMPVGNTFWIRRCCCYFSSFRHQILVSSRQYFHFYVFYPTVKTVAIDSHLRDTWLLRPSSVYPIMLFNSHHSSYTRFQLWSCMSFDSHTWAYRPTLAWGGGGGKSYDPVGSCKCSIRWCGDARWMTTWRQIDKL